MVQILHDLQDPRLWELWYIPYEGYRRIYSISSVLGSIEETPEREACLGYLWLS